MRLTVRNWSCGIKVAPPSFNAPISHSSTPIPECRFHLPEPDPVAPDKMPAKGHEERFPRQD